MPHLPVSVLRFPAPPARRERLPLAERLASIIAIQNDLVAADLDVDAVQRLVALKAQRLTPASAAVVERVEDGALVYRACSGAMSHALGTRVPLQGSLSGLCVTSNEVQLCEDTETDPRVHLELCRRLGVRSMVVAPLRHDGQNVGVLKVLAVRPHAFGPEDVDTLQLMAGFIAAAIARAAALEARSALLREREEAARALEERSAMVRALLDASPFLMGVVQREGADFRHVAVSASAARRLGPPGSVGKLGSELGYSARTLQDLQTAFAEAERTGSGASLTWSQGAGPARRNFVTTVGALPARPDEPQRRFCFFTEEVTERQRLRERADLSERMAVVGRLAAGVAHEANNPLAFTIANLGFLAEHLATPASRHTDADRQEAADALAQALEGAERVRRIVKELHTFARADTEPVAEVSLEDVADRALTLAAHELGPGARLARELRAAPPVTGSRSRLVQVVLNLLVNAAQALPQGRAPGANRVRITTGTTPDGRAFLEVQDSGRGIAPELLSHIFEPFFTTRMLRGGIGLGLSTSHNIVTDHGGELSAESVLGEGSTFRLVLPPRSPPG